MIQTIQIVDTYTSPQGVTYEITVTNSVSYGFRALGTERNIDSGYHYERQARTAARRYGRKNKPLDSSR